MPRPTLRVAPICGAKIFVGRAREPTLRELRRLAAFPPITDRGECNFPLYSERFWGASEAQRPDGRVCNRQTQLGKSAAMQLKPTTSETATRPEVGNAPIATGLPISRAELEKLVRWLPAKEVTLLFEIYDRARSDPDLTRPALLLCSAYATTVARMLDQDPFPTVTKKIKDHLAQLRERDGL